MPNRFVKPSLSEILKYPVSTLLWQAIHHARQTIKAEVAFSKTSYTIVLTPYKLTFKTMNQYAIILDASFYNDSKSYSIYKDRYDIIRNVMYAVDDYIHYFKTQGVPIGGITFGTSPFSILAKQHEDNISRLMYKNLTDYYFEVQPSFTYDYLHSKLHLCKPLVKSHINDIVNSNLTIDML